MPAVDDDLKEGIKNAKSKRSYFAFIQKSASDGTLLVDKSKIKDTVIATAKKARGGSTTVKGACFGENGRFVFEMSKVPDDKEKFEETLNKVIKRDAGVSVDSLCRKGNAPDLLDGNQPQDTPTTGGLSPETLDEVPQQTAQSGNPLEKAYLDKRKPVETRLKDGLKQKRADSPRLKEIFAYSEGCAKKKQFDRGIQGLTALETMLSKPPVAAPQIGNERKEYIDRRKPIESRLLNALKKGIGNIKAMATSFKIAESRAKGDKFDGAHQALDAVEKFLRGAVGGAQGGTTTTPTNGSSTPQNTNEPEPTNYDVVINSSADIDNLRKDGSQLPSDYGNDPNWKELDRQAIESGQDPNKDYNITDPDQTGNVGQQLPDDYNITDPDQIGTAGQQPQQQGRVSANPELDALLDQNMDPARLEAELALQVDEINTAWANGIDLSNAKVAFPTEAKSGSFGTLGFIESDDPNMPKLVIKVPLKKEGAEDLQHEADFYKKVGEHPNLCKCKGIVQVDGQRGLVMEAVEGDNMTKSMAKIEDAYKSGKISHQEYWGTVQYMMRETLKGLAALEQAGVVHNDIRSDNIMVDENTGAVKIVDFGVAVDSGDMVQKFPRHTGTTSPDLVGDSGRMDGKVTPAHDAFSVGSMAYKAGEGQNFDYNQPGVHFRENRVGAFAAFAPPDQVAVRPGDQNTPVATQNPDGTMKKTPGRTGADTDYTRFVNQMMDPDPTKRLSPSKALEDPFLADSPIDDEAARKLIAKLMGKSPQTAEPIADEPAQYSITDATEEQQQSGNSTEPGRNDVNAGVEQNAAEEVPHYN